MVLGILRLGLRCRSKVWVQVEFCMVRDVQSFRATEAYWWSKPVSRTRLKDRGRRGQQCPVKPVAPVRVLCVGHGLGVRDLLVFLQSLCDSPLSDLLMLATLFLEFRPRERYRNLDSSSTEVVHAMKALRRTRHLNHYTGNASLWAGSLPRF